MTISVAVLLCTAAFMTGPLLGAQVKAGGGTWIVLAPIGAPGVVSLVAGTSCASLVLPMNHRTLYSHVSLSCTAHFIKGRG